MLAAEEIPKVTDWMQGWGSIAAVLVSGLAVIFTGWLLRHEVRARRLDEAHREAEAADRQAAQARLIVPVVTECLMQSTEYPTAVTHVKWKIENYSSLPILGLRLVFDGPVEVEGFMTELSTGVEQGAAELKKLFHRGKDDPLPFFEPIIVFTDSSGLVWQRNGTKAPERKLSEQASRVVVTEARWQSVGALIAAVASIVVTIIAFLADIFATR
ncbi:hypothetical protein [Micromonospora sp. NPDC007220]|uniref:hypothetical protein n=1 Tax=Micromonospora sp. NPDC007220 TaxID=3154318 RepID=UPI0033C7374B